MSEEKKPCGSDDQDPSKCNGLSRSGCDGGGGGGGSPLSRLTATSRCGGGRQRRRVRDYLNQRRAVRIDEICRFLFPGGFAIFNALYWTYYREEEDLSVNPS